MEEESEQAKRAGGEWKKAERVVTDRARLAESSHHLPLTSGHGVELIPRAEIAADVVLRLLLMQLMLHAIGAAARRVIGASGASARRLLRLLLRLLRLILLRGLLLVECLRGLCRHVVPSAAGMMLCGQRAVSSLVQRARSSGGGGGGGTSAL